MGGVQGGHDQDATLSLHAMLPETTPLLCPFKRSSSKLHHSSSTTGTCAIHHSPHAALTRVKGHDPLALQVPAHHAGLPHVLPGGQLALGGAAAVVAPRVQHAMLIHRQVVVPPC